MTRWTILCDFDGTVSVEDVIDSLLERFGGPGWMALERDWRDGRINARECMTRQVGLLRMTPAELDEHLGGLRIDPAFPVFVRKAQALDVPLHIVSDGLDDTIHRLLRRHGLDDLPVSASHLAYVGSPGKWRLTSPFGAAGCAGSTCKCACAAQAARMDSKTLLIGDGASDFCCAEHVDFVFAKHKLIEHCRRLGVPHVPIDGFADALMYLPRLLDGCLLEEVPQVAEID